MARLPYADLTQPDVSPLAQEFIASRGTVLHLHHMLMHSGPIAREWLKYLNAIRYHNSLNGAVREMVIVRIAQLNRAPYEAEQHEPIALKEGMTQAQLDEMERWESSSLFSEQEKAALAYTDAMTRNVQVPDDIFAAVKAHFEPRQLVELTATIATYNMVSRFLEALQIKSDDER